MTELKSMNNEEVNELKKSLLFNRAVKGLENRVKRESRNERLLGFYDAMLVDGVKPVLNQDTKSSLLEVRAEIDKNGGKLNKKTNSTISTIAKLQDNYGTVGLKKILNNIPDSAIKYFNESRITLQKAMQEKEQTKPIIISTMAAELDIDFKADSRAIDLSDKNKHLVMQIKSHLNQQNKYTNNIKMAFNVIARASKCSLREILQVSLNVSEKDLKSFDDKNTTDGKPTAVSIHEITREAEIELAKREGVEIAITTISMADVLSGKASDTALKNQQDRQAEAGHRFFTKNSSDEKSKSH